MGVPLSSISQAQQHLQHPSTKHRDMVLASAACDAAVTDAGLCPTPGQPPELCSHWLVCGAACHAP